jgi:hypothetical protein
MARCMMRLAPEQRERACGGEHGSTLACISDDAQDAFAGSLTSKMPFPVCIEVKTTPTERGIVGLLQAAIQHTANGFSRNLAFQTDETQTQVLVQCAGNDHAGSSPIKHACHGRLPHRRS